MAKPVSLIPESELSKLKEQVLNAVLNDQSMPGSNKKLHFPDLPFVLDQPDIYLMDDSIRNTITIEKINKPLQVVSQETIDQKVKESGRITHFMFHTKQAGKEKLLLTLETKVASPGQRASSLTSMQLKFQKFGKEWKIIEEPTSLSA